MNCASCKYYVKEWHNWQNLDDKKPGCVIFDELIEKCGHYEDSKVKLVENEKVRW